MFATTKIQVEQQLNLAETSFATRDESLCLPLEWAGREEFSPRVFRSRIVLVTPYPSKSGVLLHGVAGYARDLARTLAALGVEFEVWADRNGGGGALIEDDAGFRVVRAWRPGVWAGLDLWRTLRQRSTAVLHAQVEHFVYGGGPGLASMLAFLVTARLTGRKVIVTLHHVLDLNDVTVELLRETGLEMSPALARRLLRLSTQLSCRLAHRVIVHDRVFQERLHREYGVDPTRVDLVPHGVPLAAATAAPEATRQLLMFGYLKWYKGIDIALAGFREVARDFPGWRLVIAGGLPGGLDSGHPYRRYLAELHRLAAPVWDQVEFAGYVDDAAIPSLYAQSDLVLFPYRLLFAASGPMAMAIGFRRPFILSEALRPILPAWPLWSLNTPVAWAEAMSRAMGDERVQAQALDAVQALAVNRAWPNVAARTVTAYEEVEPLIPAARAL